MGEAVRCEPNILQWERPLIPPLCTGDLIYLETLGKKMVVLNSSAAAFELLDKRSSIYSYRPKFTMANEV